MIGTSVLHSLGFGDSFEAGPTTCSFGGSSLVLGSLFVFGQAFDFAIDPRVIEAS